MLASFVTCISISLVAITAITLGGLLIFASYELTLIEGIEAIEHQNNSKMMYFTCLAIGSIFITAGALLAWIFLDLGLLQWGSQNDKFVFHEWKILVSEDRSSTKSVLNMSEKIDFQYYVKAVKEKTMSWEIFAKVMGDLTANDIEKKNRLNLILMDELRFSIEAGGKENNKENANEIEDEDEKEAEIEDKDEKEAEIEDEDEKED